MILKFNQLSQNEKDRISIGNVEAMILNEKSRLSNPFLTRQMRAEIEEQIEEYNAMAEYARRRI